MEHEFKNGDWVEWNGEVLQINAISHAGYISLTEEYFFLDPNTALPLTLRSGDHYQPIGQEYIGDIREAYEAAGLRHALYDGCILAFQGSIAVMPLGEVSLLERKLTREQILSTLPTEEEPYWECPSCKRGNKGEVCIWCSAAIKKPTEEAVKVLGNEVEWIATDEADVLPDLSEYSKPSIDWTKPVQTRNGSPRELLFLGKQLALLSANGTEYSIGLDGKSTLLLGDHPGDIINVPVKRKLEGFLSIYPDGVHIYYAKMKEAKNLDGPDCIACIDLSKHKITFTEGEGL